jgi:hypothetical protein
MWCTRLCLRVQEFGRSEWQSEIVMLAQLRKCKVLSVICDLISCRLCELTISYETASSRDQWIIKHDYM